MTNDQNRPVWQWPYSAFGTTKPTGILKATAKPKNAMANQPVMLKGTQPAQRLNLRHPGQYDDPETGTFQNGWRSYDYRIKGGYSQADPIGTRGGLNRFAYVEGNALSAIDPMGLVRKLDPNSQECKDLRAKMSNKRLDINKRIRELAENPQNLPYYPPYPGAKPRFSQQGHEEIIQDLKDTLGDDERLYKEKCGGGDDPPGGGAAAPVCGGNCQQVLKAVKNAVTGAIIFTIVLLCAAP